MPGVGPEQDPEVVSGPEISLHSTPPTLSWEKEKSRGNMTDAVFLQNELIAWQSHREMRLAGEYSMEEAEACKWRWEKASVSVTHGAWAMAAGQRPLTQLGRTAQSWATWEQEPQAKEQACAVHKATLTSGHPHGYMHMAQDREEHPLSCVHPPQPPTTGSLCLGVGPRACGSCGHVTTSRG